MYILFSIRLYLDKFSSSITVVCSNLFVAYCLFLRKCQQQPGMLTDQAAWLKVISLCVNEKYSNTPCSTKGQASRTTPHDSFSQIRGFVLKEWHENWSQKHLPTPSVCVFTVKYVCRQWLINWPTGTAASGAAVTTWAPVRFKDTTKSTCYAALHLSRACVSGCYGFWCCPCMACSVAGEFGENRCLPLCDIFSPAITASCGLPLCVPPAALALRVAIRHRYGIKVATPINRLSISSNKHFTKNGTWT